MEGHHTVSGDDTAFYRSLPNTTEVYRNTRTDMPEVPRPDTEQLITVLGSGVLSSTVLAAATKAWLGCKKTKIEIVFEGSKKSFTFEGPNLEKSQAEIERLISKLSEEPGSNSLTPNAEHTSKIARNTSDV
jgi:hypothetical protein